MLHTENPEKPNQTKSRPGIGGSIGYFRTSACRPERASGCSFIIRKQPILEPLSWQWPHTPNLLTASINSDAFSFPQCSRYLRGAAVCFLPSSTIISNPSKERIPCSKQMGTPCRRPRPKQNPYYTISQGNGRFGTFFSTLYSGNS